jgi:Zn-dependent alcohol dehydrogenase
MSPLETLAIVTTPPIDNVPQWSLETIAVQPLAENELLVEIVATGVCHTDITASLFPIGQGGIYPKVMGHEGS